MNDAMRKAAEARAAGNGRPPVASTIGSARSVAFPAQEIRAALVEREGREYYRLDGHATVFERAYEMWDIFGPYMEVVSAGAADETLASGPDVAFLTNHRGLTMARTAGIWNNNNATLLLSANSVAMPVEAYLNPNRQDVRDLVSAIDDKLVTEMSFAFQIPDGGASWNDDFTEFRINKFDINRGDVSAVNYGANPYTSIAARSREIMRDLDHLPAGAARAAIDRLRARDDLSARPARTPAAPDASGGAVHLYEALPAID